MEYTFLTITLSFTLTWSSNTRWGPIYVLRAWLICWSCKNLEMKARSDMDLARRQQTKMLGLNAEFLFGESYTKNLVCKSPAVEYSPYFGI